jgi:uncharacterized membrane protein YccC
LLEVTSLHKWSGAPTPTITVAEFIEPGKVVEMITRLRQAADTLQRFGQGTRSSKRIRKTLVKLVQICMTLVQFSPEHGPVILSALSQQSTQQQQHLDAALLQQQQQQQQQHDLAVQQLQQHDNMGHHPPSVLPNNAEGNNLATFGPDDPFVNFDMGMQQYWTDANLDLFTDLVGVETGLSAMLSG